MKNILKRIEVEPKVIEYVQGVFEDYSAKLDLLTSIFRINSREESPDIVNSPNFIAYEKKFAESKLIYDTVMKEIQEKYIPDEWKKNNYNFEVNFEDNTLDITENK